MNTVLKDWITHAGLRAVILLIQNSHHCGYVGVDALSGWYFDTSPDVDVHGGITYSDGNTDYPVPSDPPLWWIGFDCAHAGDATRNFATLGDVWRDEAYVTRECERLAHQLKTPLIRVGFIYRWWFQHYNPPRDINYWKPRVAFIASLWREREEYLRNG